jgi:hypothetical protein
VATVDVQLQKSTGLDSSATARFCSVFTASAPLPVSAVQDGSPWHDGQQLRTLGPGPIYFAAVTNSDAGAGAGLGWIGWTQDFNKSAK